MILENKINSEVLGIDKDCTIDMTISESDKAVLMMILSQNLYIDPIGSLVREIFSNAKDSNISAAVTDPIDLKLCKIKGQFVFSIKDTGLGMSPQLIEDVYSKYCASTKRNDAKAIGFYGIGKLSPLSYTDSFLISSIYEGKKSEYMMFKGQEGTQISLLDISDTTDHNGVVVSVSLKDQDDYEMFLQKIKEQLCYAEMVNFQSEYNDLTNDHKILCGDGWKYSEMNLDNSIHISLDNIYYPLAYDKIGLESIKMPIALTFTLEDGLTPTPNRESLIMNPHTKELILQRLKHIGIFFVNKWNENAPSAPSIEEAHRLHEHFGEVILYQEKDVYGFSKTIKVKVDKKLAKFCELEMKGVVLSLFPNLDVEFVHQNMAHLLQEYRIYGSYQNNKYTTKFYSSDSEGLFVSSLYNKDIYYLKQGEFLSKQQINYLKWKERDFLVVRKHSELKLKKYYGPYNKSLDITGCYYGLCKLEKKPKSEWRTIITEYQNLIKSYITKFSAIESIDPDNDKDYQKYKVEHKSQRKQAIYNNKEEISFWTIQYSSRSKKSKYIGNTKFTYKLSELASLELTYVYCKEEIEDKDLKDCYNLLEGNDKIKLVFLSERNYNKLVKNPFVKTLKNWIKLEDFFQTKNDWLSNLLTNVLLTNTWESIEETEINPHAAILDQEIIKEYNTCISIKNYSNSTNHQLDEYLRLYDKNQWLEYNRIDEFKKVMMDVHKFDFLNVFNFNYKDQSVIKKFALILYNQQEEEIKNGIYPYKRYDMDKIVSDNILKEPEIVSEIEELEEDQEDKDTEENYAPGNGNDIVWDDKVITTNELMEI